MGPPFLFVHGPHGADYGLMLSPSALVLEEDAEGADVLAQKHKPLV